MDIRKYIYSHCVCPQEISVFDSFSQSKVRRLVPCGKCLHCLNQHKNEWTTRLYAHSKYVKNVYYITLDYAPFDPENSTAQDLAAETAAAWHDINSTHSFGLHPILLRREHLQRYFKRLRKNFPNRSFQYFACGEYGTHANGNGYGRPHFHIIIFTNDTFTSADFAAAWSVNGYQIGRVDFNDLRANGSFLENIKKDNSLDARFVFAYVCKYLQKGSFDWNKIATLFYHKAYFNTLLQYTDVENADELFRKYKIKSLENECTQKDIDRMWSNYCKKYAPFVCCSKRPAIGLQYYEENVQRFERQDFRLFGLSKNCTAFPRYYLRKTKEHSCRFAALSETNGNSTSNSRIGSVISLLCSLRDNWNSLESWTDDTALLWRSDGQGSMRLISSTDDYLTCARAPRISNMLLSFYDMQTHVFYFWNGYEYSLKRKIRGIGFVDYGTLPIDNAITLLQNEWTPYYDKFVSAMHKRFENTQAQLSEEIERMLPNEENRNDQWRKIVYDTYQQELLKWNTKRDIISNTKNKF